MTIRSLLLSAAVAAVAVHAEDKVVGGPYAINVGPRSATVAWIVQSSEAKLGAEPGRLRRAAPVLEVRKVSYTGLEPGKTFYYEAFPGGEGTGSFKTPPVEAAPFRFIVYGDTRSRHDLHAKVVAAMSKAEPDFVVHTGDLVADGSDSAQWPVFFSIERELLRKTAFFPCLGNHERNNPQYYGFFDVKVPYYSFNWANAHFVVLNSDLGNVAQSGEARRAYWDEQLKWLEEDLVQSRKADFIFAVFHHPPFTAVKRRQGDNRDVARIVPLMEKYRVAAVFNGHDHNYQHHLFNGVRYIVTGGGGAPLYPVDAPMEGITQKVVSTEHFVEVQVAGKEAHIQAVALDGSILDRIVLKSGNAVR